MPISMLLHKYANAPAVVGWNLFLLEGTFQGKKKKTKRVHNLEVKKALLSHPTLSLITLIPLLHLTICSPFFPPLWFHK